MKGFKEIVTKAIVGKCKKNFKNNYEITLEEDVDTVLGCWVINHIMRGENYNGKVKVTGSFDVNIWYSFENNTKTNVALKKVNYEHTVDVNLYENTPLTTESEIIIRSLKNPTCIEVNNIDNVIKYVIEKELGIEIIGDAKVKIAIIEDTDDYEVNNNLSEEELDEIVEEIDIEENYLN